jgi:hypothetical protein
LNAKTYPFPNSSFLCILALYTFRLSTAGLCDSVSLDADTQCRTVRGVTSILLDSDAAKAESTAYATIERVLRDTFFLNQFTVSDLIAAAFVRPLGENLVVLTTTTIEETEESSSGSDGRAVIAIATASVSFLLTGVFLYGLYRSRQRSRRDSALSPVKARIAHYQAKRRRYFHDLDHHQQLEPGWMVTDEACLEHHHDHEAVDVAPSITWSVSDLTSESGSIRSSTSMSYAAKLERIVEVEEAPSDEERPMTHDDLDDGMDEIDLECPSSSPSIRDVQYEHLNFIAHWNHLTSGMEIVSAQEATQGGRTSRNDVKEQEEEKATMPVRKGNRIEDFDATGRSCPFLEESMEDDVDVELVLDEQKATTTIVRKNRVEDHGGTGEDDTLHGCRFLDESMEEDADANDDSGLLAVDASNDSSSLSVNDSSSSSHKNSSFFTIIRNSSALGDPLMNMEDYSLNQVDPIGDESIGGAPMDNESIDGAPIDNEAIEDPPMDIEAIEGALMDNEAIDGAPTNNEAIDGALTNNEAIEGAPTENEASDQYQQQHDYEYQYDQELQLWYENVLLQLYRALHQKRLE